MTREKQTSSRSSDKRIAAPAGVRGASDADKSGSKGSGKKESAKKTAVKPLESAELKTKEDVRSFVLSIRDRMADDGLAAIHALSALNCVLASGDVYRLLDNESKEIARDIFLRIKQAGVQVRNPGLLFQE